jgi:phage gp36-like protein
VSYTNLDQLIKRFGAATLIQLTDRAVPPAGAIDTAVVDDALANADAVIDASLAVRYRLPLASVPAVVADLALIITIYKLHVFAADPKIERDYDQALKDLRDIADGRKKLDVAGLEPASSGAGGVVASDRPRDLTPETLHGFI